MLYNRTHHGVTTFLLALVHAGISVGFYHGFGRINAFESLLMSNTQYRSISAFPFETLGLGALLILYLMEARRRSRIVPTGCRERRVEHSRSVADSCDRRGRPIGRFDAARSRRTGSMDG